MRAISIQVYDKQELVHSTECPGSVELGRQVEGEAAPYARHYDANRWRVVIARMDEKQVSRRFLTAEALATGRVRVTNLTRVPIRVLGGAPLDPGASRESSVPVFVVIGDKKIGVQPIGTAFERLPKLPEAVEAALEAEARVAPAPLLEEDSGAPLQTLADVTTPPGAGLAAARARLAASAPGELHDETVIRWLQAAMDVLQSAASSSQFFDKAAAALVDLVGLESGQVLLYQDETWHQQAYQDSRHRPGDERQPSRSVLKRVLAEKRTFWQTPGTATQGSLVGVNAVVAAPILDKDGAVIGVLYGDRQGHSALAQPLTRTQALLVELLAGGVAAGVARIEQEQAELQRQKKFLVYERELQIGRHIQVGFLPETLPEPRGWEIVAHFQPAREVAGDFYDSFPLSANHVALVIADVCDKGVGAALFMALFRSLIRAFCIQTPLMVLMGVSNEAPAVQSSENIILPTSRRRAGLFGDLITLLTVELTNKYVTSNHGSACMFVTLFIGILDTTTGELSYVNAGHDSPTVIGPEGVKTRLTPTGPVVGILADAAFDLSKVWLQRGDILLMHTDGVTDARNAEGKSFTEKRLLGMLEAGAPSAAALVERIATELRAHIGEADQFDDITLLAARWAPEPPT